MREITIDPIAQAEKPHENGWRELFTSLKPGMSVDEIVAAAEEQARWSVEITERYQDETEPGEVLAQSPRPGTPLLAGDRIGIGAPGYPSYRQILRALDLQPVDLLTAPDGHRGSALVVLRVGQRGPQGVGLGPEELLVVEQGHGCRRARCGVGLALEAAGREVLRRVVVVDLDEHFEVVC